MSLNFRSMFLQICSPTLSLWYDLKYSIYQLNHMGKGGQVQNKNVFKGEQDQNWRRKKNARVDTQYIHVLRKKAIFAPRLNFFPPPLNVGPSCCRNIYSQCFTCCGTNFIIWKHDNKIMLPILKRSIKEDLQIQLINMIIASRLFR